MNEFTYGAKGPRAVISRAQRQASANTRTPGQVGNVAGRRLTLDEKREIVRSVKRWEKPVDIARRLDINQTTVSHTMRAYKAGKFSMTDEATS